MAIVSRANTRRRSISLRLRHHGQDRVSCCRRPPDGCQWFRPPDEYRCRRPFCFRTVGEFAFCLHKQNVAERVTQIVSRFASSLPSLIR